MCTPSSAENCRKRLFGPIHNPHCRNRLLVEKCPIKVYRDNTYQYSRERSAGQNFWSQPWMLSSVDVAHQRRSSTYLPAVPWHPCYSRAWLRTLSKTHMDVTADECSLTKNAEEFPWGKLDSSWLQPPPSSPFSDERDHRKNRCEQQLASTPKAKEHTSEAKQKDRSSTASSDHNKRTTYSDHDSPIPGPTEKGRCEELPKPLITGTEQKLPGHQAVIPQDCQAIECRTHLRANCCTHYHNIVSDQTSKMVKSLKFYIKGQFFDRSDPISIIFLLAIFKLACDTNCNHEKAGIRILLCYLKNDFAASLRSRIAAVRSVAPAVASVNTVKWRTQKKLYRSYLEVVNYLLKKVANGQAIAKMNFAIMCYTTS